MPEFTSYPPNTFCWPELVTTDTAGAKKFYAALFGWKLDDNPVGEDAVYTMASINGKNTGAMYQQNEEQKKQEIPACWLSYVSVTDANATAEKAKALGGKVVHGPMDVFDIGRMAMLTDPQAAPIAIWQPLKHIGAEIANEPGALTWNELFTNDIDGSGAFYTNLFDWGSETADMGGMLYTSFMNGDRPAGGMLKVLAEWGDVPPHWLVYFAVADCDASAKKIKQLGGKISMEPSDIPQIGRFAMAQDPQGAMFAIIKLANAS